MENQSHTDGSNKKPTMRVAALIVSSVVKVLRNNVVTVFTAASFPDRGPSLSARWFLLGLVYS
jgi:hypothetical protein